MCKEGLAHAGDFFLINVAFTAGQVIRIRTLNERSATAERYSIYYIEASHTFCRCFGKENNVGTASGCSRVRAPVLTKQVSVKWSLQILLHGDGVHLSLLKFATQRWYKSGLQRGNLRNKRNSCKTDTDTTRVFRYVSRMLYIIS